MEEITKIIDIKKTVRNSKSKFVRNLPGFVINMISRLVREGEMNTTIHNHRHKTGIPFVNDVLKEWNVTVDVKGGENIPESGRFVFVANHPVGGMDALSFLSAIHRFFPNVVSPSNQLFNYIPNLHPVILGVNVFGTNTRDTVEKFNLLFESDAQIMIFPAGIVSRKVNGVISDPVWQKTFISKAIQYKRDIIPVFIEGRNSNLFYRVDRIRKFFGIKMSIEIILLPREMHKQRNSTVTLNFGKPLPYQTFTADKTHSEWALFVREIVYKSSTA